MITRFWNL